MKRCTRIPLPCQTHSYWKHTMKVFSSTLQFQTPLYSYIRTNFVRCRSISNWFWYKTETNTRFTAYWIMAITTKWKNFLFLCILPREQQQRQRWWKKLTQKNHQYFAYPSICYKFPDVIYVNDLHRENTTLSYTVSPSVEHSHSYRWNWDLRTIFRHLIHFICVSISFSDSFIAQSECMVWI